MAPATAEICPLGTWKVIVCKYPLKKVREIAATPLTSSEICALK